MRKEINEIERKKREKTDIKTFRLTDEIKRELK